MDYLCLPMADQGAYVIKKIIRFEVIPELHRRIRQTCSPARYEIRARAGR